MTFQSFVFRTHLSELFSWNTVVTDCTKNVTPPKSHLNTFPYKIVRRTATNQRHIDVTKTTSSSAIAEIARGTIRSVIAINRLTLTVTLNMAYVNFISPR